MQFETLDISGDVDAPTQPESRASGGPRGNAVADLGEIGVYELFEKLGEGGMGAVYKALHRKLERVVALGVA